MGSEYRGSEFQIGYTDRLAGGIVRVAFADVRLEKEPRPALTFVSEDGSIQRVPLHRVREVWKDEAVIWRRPGPSSAGCERGAGRLAFCVAVAALLFGVQGLLVVGNSQQPGATRTGQVEIPALQAVREWALAVDLHEFGTFDEHARRIAEWDGADVRLLGVDLQAVLQFLARERGDTFKQRGQSLTLEEVGSALRLTGEETRARDVTRIVRRGALLHADIARRSTSSGLTEWGKIPAFRPGDLYGVVMVSDGQVGGDSSILGHWRFGRFLLEWVGPDPSRDPTVVAWYRGAAAFLQGIAALADVQVHLGAALQLLPTDPVLLFYEGALHESFASPHIQAAVESTRQARGFRFDIEGTAGELRRARGAYRRACGNRPRLPRGTRAPRAGAGTAGQPPGSGRRPGESGGGNQRSSPAVLGALVPGGGVGGAGQARRGPRLVPGRGGAVPRAQSPRLALAQLQWRAGDRRAAGATILDALTQPGRDVENLDPWWDYLVSSGRHANRFFEHAWEACLQAERR